MLRRLWILALVFAAPGAWAQLQDIGFSNPVSITATTPVALATLVVPGSGVSDVALSAHVYLEGKGFAYDHYDIGICKGSASGSLVGEAGWSPGNRTPASGTYEADTLFVTGFEHGVALPATYVICARKWSGTSPDLTAFLRGFNAEVAPSGTTLVGVESFGIVLVQLIDSTSWTELGRLTVDAGAGSDLVLRAHVVVQGNGLGGGNRYEFGICKESASGTRVGETLWRPPLAASAGGTGDTISLTGFDAFVTGVVHYVLCARKFDSTANTITALELGIHAVRAPTSTTALGVETLGFPVSATLNSTNFVGASSLAVGGLGPHSVRLTAHAYLEGRNFDGSRYEIGICRDTASGPLVGRTLWRPLRQTTDGSYIGDAVTLTGFDGDRPGPTTYVLCARQFDPGAPTVTISDTGLVATVPEPRPIASSALAVGLLAALHARRRLARLGRR